MIAFCRDRLQVGTHLASKVLLDELERVVEGVDSRELNVDAAWGVSGADQTDQC